MGDWYTALYSIINSGINLKFCGVQFFYRGFPINGRFLNRNFHVQTVFGTRAIQYVRQYSFCMILLWAYQAGRSEIGTQAEKRLIKCFDFMKVAKVA